jgi:hypothetical protein
MLKYINLFLIYIVIMCASSCILGKSNLAQLCNQSPFDYDLGIKIVTCKKPSSAVTICCHGYGGDNSIVDVINSYNIFSGHLLGFNFPDFAITSRVDHSKSAYGTPKEILPLLYILKRCVCDLKHDKINLYGFSAGGGAIINALSALLNNNSIDHELIKLGVKPEHKKHILSALKRGLIVLDCPLKSVEEIITKRGPSKELEELARHYVTNKMIPIEVLNNLKGLNQTILLDFEKPDEVIGNRDDKLFIERLTKINHGNTIVSVSSGTGHCGYHTELWENVKAAMGKQ